MLSDNQKDLVQQSFIALAPGLDQIITLFYQRLFQMEPSLENLFPLSMLEQKRKFIEMLTVTVYGLDHYDQLGPALGLLGRRHVGYGVKPHHYKLVREALFWALDQDHKELMTGETGAAWEDLFTFLEEKMLAEV